MKQLQRFRETLALYRKHGWHLQRALMTRATLAELASESSAAADSAMGASDFEGAAAQEAEVDALWFARASAGGREAWELRLIAESPYALFELFEADEAEEERADVRREMEARLRDYALPPA